MIRQPYVHSMDFHRLTHEEAKAFIIFELMEEERHRDDIKRIQADIKNVRKVHGIEGLELSSLYTQVYGSSQSRGIRKRLLETYLKRT